ncbi:hypothetical protein REPUB_Repub05bG0142500 [Reevesia pubescens]
MQNWLCYIKHVHKEANFFTDWMATHFDNLSLGLHIFDSPPSGINYVLMVDAIGIVWSRLM